MFINIGGNNYRSCCIYLLPVFRFTSFPFYRCRFVVTDFSLPVTDFPLPFYCYRFTVTAFPFYLLLLLFCSHSFTVTGLPSQFSILPVTDFQLLISVLPVTVLPVTVFAVLPSPLLLLLELLLVVVIMVNVNDAFLCDIVYFNLLQLSTQSNNPGFY